MCLVFKDLEISLWYNVFYERLLSSNAMDESQKVIKLLFSKNDPSHILLSNAGTINLMMPNNNSLTFKYNL